MIKALPQRHGVMMCSNELSFGDFERALAFSQPHLELVELDSGFVAKGRYVLNDGPRPDGPLEEFEIELLVHAEYPKFEPIVRETGDRIPREVDRHMYGNSRCCTCVWEEWLSVSDDVSFSSFVEGPLHNFFLSQLHFELHNEWPFGERSHGIQGFVESISRILGFRVDQNEAMTHLNTIISKNTKGHWLCVCGSGKKIRDCGTEHVETKRRELNHTNLVLLRDRLKAMIRRR